MFIFLPGPQNSCLYVTVLLQQLPDSTDPTLNMDKIDQECIRMFSSGHRSMCKVCVPEGGLHGVPDGGVVEPVH